MALSDSLTAYHDNADYDSPANVAKARLFRTACRQLLIMPARSAKGKSGTELEYDIPAVKNALAEVNEWLVGRDDSESSSVVYPGFTDFRHPGG